MWFKQHWFRLCVIALLLTVLVVVSYKNSPNDFAVYEMDSDCAKDAKSFVKAENENEGPYGVLFIMNESKFDKKSMACYVEYNFYKKDVGSVYYIRDLTHNKEMVSLWDLKSYEDISSYNTHAEEYRKLRKSIFVEAK